MRFNSYFIELGHKEPSLMGNLTIEDQPVSANFKKIEDDIFIVFFKQQVELKFQEELELKNRNKTIKVVFPVLSKFNKRKLGKIAKLLADCSEKEKEDILFDYLNVEKTLRISELTDFFSFNPEAMRDILVEKELEKKVKIIDYLQLTVITYEEYLSHRSELETIFSGYIVGKEQIVKIEEIESQLKLPRSSIFFKYLIHSLDKSYPFRVLKDKIVFNKPGLSEKEKDAVKKIEAIVKRNKVPLFTIDELLKQSDLKYKELNDILWHLINSEEVTRIDKKYYIFTDELNKIMNKLKKHKRNQGEIITINDFRELTSFSRKYIIALFEYFDEKKITLRMESERKILLVV